MCDVQAALVEDAIWDEVCVSAQRLGLQSNPRPKVRLCFSGTHRYRFLVHNQLATSAVMEGLSVLGISYDRCHSLTDSRGRSTGFWVVRGRLSKRFVRSVLAEEGAECSECQQYE